MLLRALLSSGLVAASVCSQQLSQASEAALARAGDARAAYEAVWRQVEGRERLEYEFLLRHMPKSDFGKVSPALLLENVSLANEVRKLVVWGSELTDELFANYVVPYAQANETRESWRPMMVEKFLPLVRDCKTPGEAARKLNESVFDIVNVHYSTARRRPDQSPSESIEQGKASCTGLSILLADACRACCVPARLVSVRWPHKPGNHTWVEVWDGQAWRFVGADEPDPQGLDRAWFTSDAEQCASVDPQHRAWAVSFSDTGERFVAGWGSVQLWGVDVSARYAAKAKVAQQNQGGGDDALLAQFARYFQSDEKRRATFEFDRNLDEELKTKTGDARLRKLVWQAFKKHEQPLLQKDHDARVANAVGKTSPFTVKKVGTKPEGGWPLVIAMHGGGGVPKKFNDSQWRHMQIYYKDHPEVGGYLYCALRAPTDEWNGFYTDYFYPVIEKLIRQFVVCDDVNPDRVIAIGYSHGGYGAFAVGPKMPHRFAAVHASASAPTGGQTAPDGLHSLKFSFMVGGKDTAYGRRDRCVAFNLELQKLQNQNPGRYPTTFMLIEDNGHTGLPDRDLLKELVPHKRTPTPRHLTWRQTDGTVHDHYWLHTSQPKPGTRLDAELRADGVVLSDRTTGELWLDARLIDMAQPFSVTAARYGSDYNSPGGHPFGERGAVPSVWKFRTGGKWTKQMNAEPSLRTLCRTMAERGDPQLAATWIVSTN